MIAKKLVMVVFAFSNNESVLLKYDTFLNSENEKEKLFEYGNSLLPQSEVFRPVSISLQDGMEMTFFCLKTSFILLNFLLGQHHRESEWQVNGQ